MLLYIYSGNSLRAVGKSMEVFNFVFPFLGTITPLPYQSESPEGQLPRKSLWHSAYFKVPERPFVKNTGRTILHLNALYGTLCLPVRRAGPHRQVT